MSSAPPTFSGLSRYVRFVPLLAVLVAAPGISAQRSRGDSQHQPLIFFPPFPPALDPLAAPGPVPAQHPSAPGEMADYVGEYFYPQLSSRLHTQSLTPKQRQQLASYRANKQALLEEIRRELALQRHAEPAVRRRALQTLARKQATDLAALERVAEELRVGLIDFERSWNAHRQWHLADSERRGFSPMEIAQVMRATAYYGKSLNLAQRALLREIAVELLLARPTEAAASAAQTHMFFSPSPARVRWRDDAPAELTAKFATFQATKAALKKELYDAVCRDDTSMVRLLGTAVGELGPKQTRKIAELEALAEEIRVGLAALPPTNLLSPRGPLSPRLTEEIAALHRRREALQKVTGLKVEAVSARARERHLHVRIDFKFDPDGLKFVVVPTRRADGLSRGVQAIGQEVSAIADEYGRELVALTNAEDQLRTEIGAAIGSSKPKAIDDALLAALRSVDAQRNATAFNEYHAAVFEPGLSLEQRRVLFDGAIEQFELPLPRGEFQPRQRRETW